MNIGKNEKDSRTLSNKSNILLVGMKPIDARVIRNYLFLVKKLNEKFTLISSEDSGLADIVFVNVDSSESCREFKKYIREATFQPKLIKCSNNKLVQGRPGYLFQPVTRTALETSLNRITSTQRKTETRRPVSNSMKGSTLSMRVLVVDDSFPVRKYMEEKLPALCSDIARGVSLELDFASSGKEAVEVIKKSKGQFDIVLLDVVMEDIDGYKICKWIKSAKESIEVIMLTSKNSTFDKVRGRIAGCNSYLTKPPTDQELELVIRNVLRDKFSEQDGFTVQLKLGNEK